MLWFMVASRSESLRFAWHCIKKGVGELAQIQKDFLGDCYAENQRYLALEGARSKENKSFNREFRYNDVDSVVWYFLSGRSIFEVPSIYLYA